MRQYVCQAARQWPYDKPVMQRTAECTNAARQTEMQTKSMQGPGKQDMKQD